MGGSSNCSTSLSRASRLPYARPRHFVEPCIAETPISRLAKARAPSHVEMAKSVVVVLPALCCDTCRIPGMRGTQACTVSSDTFSSCMDPWATRSPFFSLFRNFLLKGANPVSGPDSGGGCCARAYCPSRLNCRLPAAITYWRVGEINETLTAKDMFCVIILKLALIQ